MIKQKEKVYLDTSVISAYFDERNQMRQEETIKFFDKTLSGYEAYISDLTIKELGNVKDRKLKLKFKILVRNFRLLKVNKKIITLAEDYVRKEIFPEKYFDDALHVAVASYYEISYLISWNFEHLVKVKTRRLVNLVNSLDNIREIEIISPLEL